MPALRAQIALQPARVQGSRVALDVAPRAGVAVVRAGAVLHAVEHGLGLDLAQVGRLAARGVVVDAADPQERLVGPGHLVRRAVGGRAVELGTAAAGIRGLRG